MQNSAQFKRTALVATHSGNKHQEDDEIRNQGDNGDETEGGDDEDDNGDDGDDDDGDDDDDSDRDEGSGHDRGGVFMKYSAFLRGSERLLRREPFWVLVLLTWPPALLLAYRIVPKVRRIVDKYGSYCWELAAMMPTQHNKKEHELD